MFNGKIHYFDWAMFNSYFDITKGYHMLHGQWGDQWGGLLTYDLSLLFRALDTGCGYPPFEEPPVSLWSLWPKHHLL